MKTSVLIFMLTVMGTVATIAIYLIIRTLRNDKQNEKSRSCRKDVSK